MRHLVRILLDLATRPADAGSDADLLARFARDRDGAAFAALVDRHGPMVLGVARRILRDPDAADDAFQATFLALARSAAGITRPGGLPAWLHRTAVRAATRLARARRPAPLDRDPPAAAADPLDALTARELLAAVDDELHRLPAPLRAAVVACGLEGRSQEEAARLLGWTPGQVRGRLERGRRRLEARLARRGLAPAAGGVLLLSAPPALSARHRESAIALATGTAVAPPALASLAAAAGRTLPVRSAVALAVGVVALALAGFAPGRPYPETAAPIPPDAESGEAPLPAGAVRRFGTSRLRVGDGPLAVTPDGKSVVALSPQGRVRVLDAGTGRVTAEYQLPLKAEAFYTGSAALLSADGSTAVTQLWNADATGNTLTAWDLAARRPLWSWTTVNGGTTETAALTADGKRLFVVEPSADWARSKIKAVDLATGRERVVFDRAGPVNRLHVSPDGKRVVLVGGEKDNRPAACHDAETGAKLWVTALFGSVAAFSPDGAVLFTECRDPSSRALALDARTGESVLGLKFPDQIFEMSLAPTASPDGRTVLVGDAKMRGFVIWDYRDGKEVGVIPGYAYEGGYPRRSAVFSRDGKVLFTGLDRLGRWDATTGRALDPAEPADGHASPVAGVRYSPDGREVYSLDTRWQYRRWAAAGRLRDAGEAKPEPTRNPGDRGGVTRAGDVTMVFDRFPVTMPIREKAPEPGAQFERFPPLPLLTVPVAEGRRELVLRDEMVGEKRRFYVSGGAIAAGVELPWTKAVPARPVSPCGRWVVVGGTVYATATGRAVLAPEAPGVGGRPARQASDAMRFEKVWFSPDGRFVAGTLEWQDDTPRGMRMVAVWEVASGAAFPAVPVHSHHDAAVSPGGRTLVDGGIHGITAHDLIGGKSLRLAPRDLTTGFDYRRSQPIGFHPAGRAFVTGHVDGSVVEWAVPHAARTAAAPDPDSAWADLASPDLRVARAAVERLVDHPDVAVALLKARVAPPAGGPVEGVVSGDLLRGVRTVEVLERAGTPAARALLTAWRDQALSRRLAAEAAFALDRLDQAGPPPD